MVSPRQRIILVAVGLVVFGLFVFGAIYSVHALNRFAHQTQTYSAYCALECELVVALTLYYDENGLYPESLSLLELEYSDGAHAAMLHEFRYRNEGPTCYFEYDKLPLSGTAMTRVRYTFIEGKRSVEEVDTGKIYHP